jgi:hypothetical protein
LTFRFFIDILPRNGAGSPGSLKSPFDGVSPPPPPVLASATRGGIQLGGGCENVTVAGNVIRGGIWNGITLGSLILIGDEKEAVPDRPTSFDPCDPCRPLDPTHDPPGGDSVHVRSAGDLYDITIRDNTIEDMGANGIAVVRYFNLGKTPILIAVHGLHILGNGIRRYVRREVSQPSAAMQWLVGYGGVSLAFVDRPADQRQRDRTLRREPPRADLRRVCHSRAEPRARPQPDHGQRPA